MATLKELWDAGGGKPLGLVRSDGERFTMFGITPKDFAVGYHPDTGYNDSWPDYDDGWELYEEPRPKKKLYAYINRSTMALVFSVLGDPDKAFFRVPQFDCEVDDA